MMNNVLVVDSDQTMLSSLISLLQSQGGFLNVFSAMNAGQALYIMRKRRVKIVITALQIAEIDRFELVAQLVKEYPATKIIVMATENTPLLRARIEQYPSAIYLDQTHDLSMLSKRVFTELQIDYGGQVRGINLTSFLQMMAMDAVSCTLKVTCKDQYGFLWLDQGELIAAKLPQESGKSAAMKILAWKNVYIDIDYTPRRIKQEISEPLMMLMLESGQMDDEFRNENGDKRKYARHELMVALDFDIKNMKRQCSLWDISRGGAYIKTDHDISIGECITLSLSSPVLKNTCTLDAKVVRKDRSGIGVKFLPISQQQQEMIKVMINSSVDPLSWHDKSGELPPIATIPS
jgi:CheY-like chemotaxis protein